MSGTEPYEDERRRLRQQFKDGSGEGSEPTGRIFSVLLGFTLGFLISAGVVVLLRTMISESDGTRALNQSLVIFVPSLILLVIALIVRKITKSAKGLSRPVGLIGGVIGIFYGAAIWVTVPTNKQIATEMLAGNRDLIRARAAALAGCRAQLDAIPAGTLGERITEAQLAELKGVAMDFRHNEYHLPETWNAILTVDTDYARLKPETDPDTIMDTWARPDSAFFPHGDFRHTHDLRDFVDNAAVAAYGSAYLWPDTLERQITELKQLKYLVILRLVKRNPPLLTGDEFKYGYIEGEAFCFDLEAKRLIAGFPFAATNSDEVNYNYAQNANVMAQADSAGAALSEDLDKNGWNAALHRLQVLAEGTLSPVSEEKLPYTELSLAEAMLVFNEKQRMDQEREKAVREKLQAVGEPAKEEPAEEPAASSPSLRLSAGEEAEVRKLLAEQGLIAAVKKIRDLTGMGLAECKAYAESLGVTAP